MRVAFVASDLEKLLADINRVGKGEVSLEFEMDGDLGLPKEANNKKKGKGGKKKKKGKKKA